MRCVVSAARRGQRKIQQDDVGGGLLGGGECSEVVFGLRYDVEVSLALQDVAHPHAEEGMVIDQHDLHAHVRSAPIGAASPAFRAAASHGTTSASA